MRRILTIGALAALSLGYAVGLRAAECGGDCDGDGAVAINELVRAVGVALGATPLAQCGAADGNGDGSVTIAELIAAVNAALGGCGAGPTATPVRTPTPSPTGGVVPGCDNGTFDVTYRPTSAGNFVTSDLTLDLVSAGQVRDPRSRTYLWSIVGFQCIDNRPILSRGVQFQYILSPHELRPGTYTLTPPFASFIYQESDDSSARVRAWDTASVTLTVEAVEGDTLTFRVAAAMKPQPLLSLGETPIGTFDLEVSGTVAHFTSQ